MQLECAPKGDVKVATVSKYSKILKPPTLTFRGCDPEIWGLNPSFFMVLGSKGLCSFSKSLPFLGAESTVGELESSGRR